MEPKMAKVIKEITVPQITFEETSNEKEAQEIQESLELERHSAERMASRPYIDHLEDAVVNGEFLVPVGQKVVIERIITIGAKTMWLDTKSYIVKKVSPESGNLVLYDNDVCQNALSNYLQGPDRGYRFKVPVKTTRLRGRGKSKPKKAKVEKTGPKLSRGNPGKPGVRRIYDVKGVICTRLKGMAYVSRKDTKAIAGERLQVSAPQGNTVTITHPDAGWSETWDAKPGM